MRLSFQIHLKEPRIAFIFLLCIAECPYKRVFVFVFFVSYFCFVLFLIRLRTALQEEYLKRIMKETEIRLLTHFAFERWGLHTIAKILRRTFGDIGWNNIAFGTYFLILRNVLVFLRVLQTIDHVNVGLRSIDSTVCWRFAKHFSLRYQGWKLASTDPDPKSIHSFEINCPRLNVSLGV